MAKYAEIIFDLKPYSIHPKIEKICNDLQCLLDETSPSKKEEWAVTVRSQLLKIEDDPSFNVLNRHELMKIVLRTLDQLSIDYPINQEDPISLIPLSELPSRQVVHLSSGYHFHIPTLVQQFNYTHQNIFTFENPVTRTRIPFRDGLLIHQMAEQQRPPLSLGRLNVNVLENTVCFRNLLTHLHNMPPQQFGRLMESWSVIYENYQDMLSKLLALSLCYGLQYGLEFYFSFLSFNQTVVVKKPENAGLHFMIFNGLPSFFLLSLMLFLKRKRTPQMTYDFSQINYLYDLFLAHTVCELAIALLKNSEQMPSLDEAKFSLRYLLAWMIAAQVVFPRQTNDLQTYYENLLSGVFSLCFEIYRHPILDARELRDYFISASFFQHMFSMPKVIVGLGIFNFFYQQIWNENSRFFTSLNHLIREYVQGVQGAPELNRAPHSP